MKNTRHPTQPDFPGLATGPEIVECHGNDLHRVLADVEAQGKFAFRVDVVGLSGYRLLVQPKPRKESHETH